MKHFITHIPLSSSIIFIGVAFAMTSMSLSARPLSLILAWIGAAFDVAGIAMAIWDYRKAQRKIREWKQQNEVRPCGTR